MIEYKSGNLLDSEAEALVNTINTVGVMGKGIALQFKQAFPDNFKAYEAACRHGQIRLGKMFVYHTHTLHSPRLIINFPTKRHWKGKSKIQDIADGLSDLVQVIKSENVRSIAVPPLGCGNGGLSWGEVKPLIERVLQGLDVKATVYAPQGAPKAEGMKVATTRPKMTPGRAAVLGLMQRYAVPGYKLTLLEIQKLAYFLQEAGEPLKLNFVKQKYGPYAEELHHVLQRMEGHFIRGYGDRTREVSVNILPDAAAEGEAFLAENHDTLTRFDRVSKLIHGFETPYGMELLSTVHWVATREDERAKIDPEAAIAAVHNWSEHKKQSFRPDHIRQAWRRLKDQDWM
jgi:O-acetyl-ADP-ribose deacetylase (regulator of RNase III)